MLERTIDGWKAREAQAGRVYTCATQTIGGFPFGIELRCADAGAELKSNQPPLALKAQDMLVSAHVWQPTVLTTEFAGPLTIAEPGQAGDDLGQLAARADQGARPADLAGKRLDRGRAAGGRPRRPARTCSRPTVSISTAGWSPARCRTIR